MGLDIFGVGLDLQSVGLDLLDIQAKKKSTKGVSSASQQLLVDLGGQIKTNRDLPRFCRDGQGDGALVFPQFVEEQLCPGFLANCPGKGRPDGFGL